MEPEFPETDPEDAPEAPGIPRALKIAILVALLLLAAAIGGLLLLQHSLRNEDPVPSQVTETTSPERPPLPLHEPLPAPPSPVSVPAPADPPSGVAGEEAIEALRSEILSRLGTVVSEVRGVSSAVGELREQVASSGGAHQASIDALSQQVVALRVAYSARKKEQAAKPPFTLKSVYRAGSTAFVDIQASGTSTTLRVGEQHQGWTLDSIEPAGRRASFRRGERTVALRVE